MSIDDFKKLGKISRNQPKISREAPVLSRNGASQTPSVPRDSAEVRRRDKINVGPGAPVRPRASKKHYRQDVKYNAPKMIKAQKIILGAQTPARGTINQNIFKTLIVFIFLWMWIFIAANSFLNGFKGLFVVVLLWSFAPRLARSMSAQWTDVVESLLAVKEFGRGRGSQESGQVIFSSQFWQIWRGDHKPTGLEVKKWTKYLTTLFAIAGSQTVYAVLPHNFKFSGVSLIFYFLVYAVGGAIARAYLLVESDSD